MVKVSGPLETVPWDYAPGARHAGGAASGASRGGLGATAAALTGAGSITAIVPGYSFQQTANFYHFK